MRHYMIVSYKAKDSISGNTLKRGEGNVNKVGQRFPIICLHLEPVIIFAVPMILNFLVEQT